jgi:hypothetical protein
MSYNSQFRVTSLECPLELLYICIQWNSQQARKTNIATYYCQVKRLDAVKLLIAQTYNKLATFWRELRQCIVFDWNSILDSKAITISYFSILKQKCIVFDWNSILDSKTWSIASFNFLLRNVLFNFKTRTYFCIWPWPTGDIPSELYTAS